jgi:hypothetical protein
LPNTVAIHLDYNEAGNRIRIGTHGRGVYETSIVTGVISYANDQPNDFKLLQNYPNPFNPATNIKYQIVDDGLVSLRIVDLLGKEVATLVNEVQKPGTYTVIWDAKGAASGMYVYVLNAGRFREARKMLLLR